MRLFAESPERHVTGVEPLDYLARQFDLFEWNRCRGKFEIEQAAQVRPACAFVIHELCKLGVRLGIIRLACVLQLINGVRVPVMVFTLNAIMDLAAEIELSDRSRFIGHTMSPQSFLADLTNPDALDA